MTAQQAQGLARIPHRGWWGALAATGVVSPLRLVRWLVGRAPAFVLLAGLALLPTPVQAAGDTRCPSGLIALQSIQGVACAEVAATEVSRERGLMFRTRLGTDQGMLFVFAQNDLHRMWMKNTLIPLSVAFIDAQGTIINIEEMAAATLTPHGATQPARYALEMTQGWFDRHHWVPGGRVLGLPPVSLDQ